MKTDKRKVALVGCGMVGMSYAYAMLNQNVCDELVLIDVDKKRAEGEAMDMNHGLAFSGSNMKIFAGSYDDCGDADIVCICAGVAQKPGETRLDLLQRNAAVFKSIIDPVTHYLRAVGLQSKARAGHRNGAGHRASALSVGRLFSCGPAQHARLCDG